MRVEYQSHYFKPQAKIMTEGITTTMYIITANDIFFLFRDLQMNTLSPSLTSARSMSLGLGKKSDMFPNCYLDKGKRN